MKKTLLLSIIIFLSLLPQHVFAQQKTDSLQKETKNIEEVVQLLENEEQTKNLLKKLKALLETQKKLSEKKQPEQEEKSKELNLVLAYRHYQTLFYVKTQELYKKLTAITSDYQKLKSYLIEHVSLYQFTDFIVKFILALAAGLFLLFLLKKSTKSWRSKLDFNRDTKIGKKIKIVGMRLLLEIYPLLVLALAVGIFLKLISPEKAALFLPILAAWVIYRATYAVILLLFSPENVERRLVGLDDETAGYISVWSHRLLLFSFWAYLFFKVAGSYGLKDLAFFIGVLYKIGFVAMITVIIAQWKEAVAARFTVKLKNDDALPARKIKGLFNTVIKNLYLVILLYFSFIIVLSILKFEKLYRFLLYSTLKTGGVAIAISGAWHLWDIVFQRFFKISDTIRQRLPNLEQQVNRYIAVLDKIGRTFILLVGFLWTVSVWQIDVLGFFSDYSDYFLRLVRIPIILSVAIMFVQIGNVLLKKFEQKLINKRTDNSKDQSSQVEAEKQIATISGLLRKAIFACIWIIAVLMVIRELGFDIGPALAGAGIFGVALGFGTQNLVRDIISGLFMIAESQIRVGDVAILNGTGGLVEAINLRTTVLRSLDGVVHVFPNGVINSLSNMTREFSFYIFDIGVAYKEDVDRVIAVLKQIGKEIMEDENFKPFILEPLEILGLDKFADSAIIIKARIKTMPIKQWLIGREMNRRIKNRFDELDIEIPFPHRTFYFGEISNPIKIKME